MDGARFVGITVSREFLLCVCIHEFINARCIHSKITFDELFVAESFARSSVSFFRLFE